MNTSEKSKVSYRAALVIFVAVAAIVVAAGLFPAKASNAAEPEKAASVKSDTKRGFSLLEWQMLARTL